VLAIQEVSMNARLITAITLTLASTTFAVRAESPTPDPYQHMIGGSARADVVVQRDMAIADRFDARMYGEDSGSFHLSASQVPGTLTRAQVQAEVLDSRARGLLDAMYGEDSGSNHLARAEHAQGREVLQARSGQ
jgi:hypothetical protein